MPKKKSSPAQNISRRLYVELNCRQAQDLLTSNGSAKYFTNKVALETYKTEIKVNYENLM
jgi:hypothetical protein